MKPVFMRCALVMTTRQMSNTTRIDCPSMAHVTCW